MVAWQAAAEALVWGAPSSQRVHCEFKGLQTDRNRPLQEHFAQVDRSAWAALLNFCPCACLYMSYLAEQVTA